MKTRIPHIKSSIADLEIRYTTDATAKGQMNAAGGWR